MLEAMLLPRRGRGRRDAGRRAPRRRGLPGNWRLEALEGRALMAAWVEQGPAGIAFGQIEGLDPQNNPVAGAIEVVLPHPTDSSIAYVGAANGGIWMSSNVTSLSPSWTPLTDDLDSLAIGAMAFDPLDSSFQTIFVGTGSFSSLGLSGGQGIGLLLTTDGGASWANLARADLAGRKIKSVIPTALLADSGQVVLVGTFLDPFPGGGLFRSEDGGNSFTRLSGDGSSGLPNAEVSHLVSDPADPFTFYAGVPNFGVYRSDDGGVTWAQINDGLVDPDMANSRVELAVHFNPELETHAVYTALLRNGQPTGFFRSDDRGDNWVEMDLPVTNEGGTDVGLNPRAKPGAQGAIHFSMLADLTDPFVVFAGGDRQPDPFPNSIGATTFSGRLFRGDASLPAGTQWEPVTHDGTETNSAPHADSRDMAFDADGNIIEVDDGGIYRLLDPNDVSGERNWVSAIGDVRPTEFHSVAYDTISNTVFGGTQDVGTPMQLVSGSTSDWIDYLQADGGVVAVDTTTDPFGRSIRYTSFQFFGFFNRSYWNPDGSASVVFEGVPLIVNGTGGQNLFQFDGSIQFYQPFELNAVDQNRMIIGTSFLYESFNRGDNLDFLGGPGVPTSAMAYGGRLSGVNNPNVIYVANFAAPNSLFLRTTAGGAFTQLVNYPGFFVRDIALDPQNWRRAYVIDFANRVWATFNAGTSWVNITGNINSFSSTPELSSIAMVSPTASIRDDIVVVGGNGGVFAIRTPGLGGAALNWIELTGLPNAVARDIRYDAADDTLVAGLQGRGAWILPNLMTEVPPIIPIAPSLAPSSTRSGTGGVAGRSALDEFQLAIGGAEALRGAMASDQAIEDLFAVPKTAKARKRGPILFNTTL